MPLVIKEDSEKFIIEIPKKISKKLVQDILKRLEIEEIASQIDISEEEINELAKKAKERWWQQEGKKILAEKGIISD